MAALGSGADGARWLHSGAVALGVVQSDAGLCLGGLRSGSRLISLQGDRVAALPGLGVVFVAGANGLGVGALQCDGAGNFRWQAPGEGWGAWQAVALGVEGVLPGETAARFVVVLVRSAVPQGTEQMGLRPVLHNALAGSDFSEAESTAGAAHYRALIAYNAGASTITSWKIWVGAGIRLGVEALDVDGGVQVIADESTAPVSVTFSTPADEAGAIELGPLAAGAGKGVWIERAVGAAAPAAAEFWAALSQKVVRDAVTYEPVEYGISRVAAAGTAGYELYVSSTADDPDPEADSPVATGATLPLTYAAAFTEGVYRAALYRRNRFGLLSGSQGVQVIRIDGDGEVAGAVPRGPDLVEIKPAAEGAGLVSARYSPGMEASIDDRATHWVVFFEAAGGTIDPEVDTPAAVVAMNNAGGNAAEILRWTSPAQLDGAPLQALVRTRRAGVDSANVAVATVTAEALGPVRPEGVAFLARKHAVQPVTPVAPDGEVTVYDAGAGCQVTLSPGRAVFEAGGVTIWTAVYLGPGNAANGLYFDTGWNFENAALAFGTPGGTDPVEVDPTWPTGKLVWIVVQGASVVRGLQIDVDGLALRGVSMVAPDSLVSRVTGDPVYARYGETVFQLWDPHAEGWLTYARVTVEGVFETVLAGRFGEVAP